jgi:hypothetical protein
MVTEQQQTEWDGLLDESAEWDGLMEEDSSSVVPPDYMQPGEIVNRPSEDSPLAMRVSSLAFKGYVEVWDNRTGVKSLQPWWLLWQTMRKKRSDGSLIFTRTDPKIAPQYGADLKCPLHPESPEYSNWISMGFKTCNEGFGNPKQHIPHAEARNRHVEHSHKRLWAAQKEERETRIRDEDRQLQRDMLEAMTGVVTRSVAVPPVEEAEKPYSAICDQCDKELRGRTQGIANNGLRLHRRTHEAKQT